ncbi:hypothetical protein KCP78_08160 [Salmonella enterica subsp. enterica]|nr:hypothetical protein KCP78_08160 [Salmonella enterica subsp. enterica]
MSLWFARFKAGYRFGQLAICCKIVQSLPLLICGDYVGSRRLTPATGDGST